MEGEKLIIYSPQSSTRFKYVTEVIFSLVLGIKYEVVTDRSSLASGPDINYSGEVMDCPVHVQPAGLLNTDSIEHIVPEISWSNGVPMLFPSGRKDTFPFDIFSASFYMLSRYEEYLEFHSDLHGRFTGSGSFAGKNGFLKLPVVDLWSIMLGNELNGTIPEAVMHNCSYRALMTFDIDQAFAYRGHGFIRNAGGLIKDAFSRYSNPLHRIGTLAGRKEDPYNLFDYMTEQVKKHHSDAIFFFPVGERSDHDRNPSFRDKGYRSLINHIMRVYETGIHSSYRSSGRQDVLNEEMKRFCDITGSKAAKCRQHWLLLKMPFTYHSFISAGISSDFTMGFADEPGFRAGIARPYPFYDLANERITDFTIVPFQVMDGTLMQYKNLSPDNAIREIDELIGITRKVGGLFVSVWHNTSLTESNGWEGWRRVFEETLRMQQQ